MNFNYSNLVYNYSRIHSIFLFCNTTSSLKVLYTILNPKIPIMKLITPILIILILGAVGCSDQQETTSKTSTHNVPATVSKVLEPQGDIKEAVLGELQQGRWELVMFWATYCHICKRDFEKLEQFIKDNPSVPLTIVGVVTDGIESKQKALTQIAERNLNYAHVLTDFDHSNAMYQEISNTTLIGVPSQLLYDTKNELIAFSRNAIDLDALEVIVHQE